MRSDWHDEWLMSELGRCLDEPTPPCARLREVCRLLASHEPGFDWVGFYFVAEGREELVLGPFVGEPTEHVRIPFGSGICGQAALRGTTLVVDDVTREQNYLACSLEVKSEIVIPLRWGEELVGELDIDSHTEARFSQEDRLFLERVGTLVAPVVASCRADWGKVSSDPVG